MINHWINKYLGMKWKNDYTCFDHFCHVQKYQFDLHVMNGINFKDMPDFEDRSEALTFIKTLKNWRRVLTPREGDAVLFGTEGATFHIGTYIQSDRVKGILNNTIKYGVVLTTTQSLTDNGSADRIYMRYWNA